MDPNTITVNGIEYIMRDSVPREPVGAFCIVRCRNAGVHAGYVASRKDGVVTLHGSRRLWRWFSKATLSELAAFGPVKMSENKYGCVLPTLVLTESDVCEVIPCTEASRDAIASVPVWVACDEK